MILLVKWSLGSKQPNIKPSIKSKITFSANLMESAKLQLILSLEDGSTQKLSSLYRKRKIFSAYVSR